MTATTARTRTPRVRAGLAYAIIEQREHTPGTRSRWTVTLVQLDALGSHPVQTWTGVGPLGRLRAQRDAKEHCARQQIAARFVPVDEAPPPAKANRAWMFAGVLARLHAEGII